MTRTERKRLFIRALAENLVVGQTGKSILLELGRPEAEEWAKLRAATPLFGYPSVDEAEKVLSEFLR